MNKNNVVLSSSLEREINICTKNEETVTIFSEESNFDAAQISKKYTRERRMAKPSKMKLKLRKFHFLVQISNFGTNFKFHL